MITVLWFVLLTCVTIIAVVYKRFIGSTKDIKDTQQNDNSKVVELTKLKLLNGPVSLPIIGSLHLLRGPDGPFDAFTRLSEIYGDIYKIKLGTANCVVVSNYNFVKEVLITKGHHFGGRPDFHRFHELFGGNRNNSLALCDWSDLQRTRRSIARNFCSPRGGSIQQQELSKIATEETRQLLDALQKPEMMPILDGKKSLKPLLLATIANMFTRYMCSTRFNYDDNEFSHIVRSFDEIFWDINQGYAVDFLPWLNPFYVRVMKRLNKWSTDIRNFILRRIIDDHRKHLDTVNGIPRDFTDALLLHLEQSESELSWDHIMYELEDFIGGHSAIGNLVMLVLSHIAMRPEVQKKIQNECDALSNGKFISDTENFMSLSNRLNTPYTEAVIWETLRITSSPIVPHVATIDTEIGGYNIKKDTIIFINNFKLNLGSAYWGEDSREFKPERFIVTTDGKSKIVKPQHFIPFSTGKRTCIGQRLVQGFAFIIITSLLSQFDICPVNNNIDDLKRKIAAGCIAVPPDSFNLELKLRRQSCE